MKVGVLKISANGYIAIVFIAGLLLIGYLFAEAPAQAASQLPLILAGVGGIVTLLLKQGQTDSEVAAAKAAAVQSAVISESNSTALIVANEKLQAVDEKVSETTDGVAQVHKIVNARDTALRAELAELRKAGEIRQEQLTETRAALTRLETTLHAEREDKQALIAAALATPVAGVTTENTSGEPGTTTIVVDPSSAMSIAATPNVKPAKSG